MSYLLIDIGNSFSKYAVYTAKIITSISREKTSLFEQSIDTIDMDTINSIKEIVLVSVADEVLTEKIVSKLSTVFNCPVQQVRTTESSYGVTCGYTDYNLLGADRWIAIIAASRHRKKQQVMKPVMIVDCGTVITVDVIDNADQHLGGWMIPGAFLMYNSLLEKSKGIKYGINKTAKMTSDDYSVFGLSTLAGVQIGNKFAEVGFIEQCFKQSENNLKESPHCIITGDGAPDIIPMLTLSVEYLPNLVFEGLALFSE